MTDGVGSCFPGSQPPQRRIKGVAAVSGDPGKRIESGPKGWGQFFGPLKSICHNSLGWLRSKRFIAARWVSRLDQPGAARSDGFVTGRQRSRGPRSAYSLNADETEPQASFDR